MKVNMEIEYKSKLDEKAYLKLLKDYDLASSQFVQTNYYFDTNMLDLLKLYITLRIRQKGDQLKITMKRRAPIGSLEQHIVIDEVKKEDYLANGFLTKNLFPEIDYEVFFQTKLVNTRVKMLYEDGVIFIDKSEYNGITDYEIEFEHNDDDLCRKIFLEFLKENKIPYQKAEKKSYRALIAR